MPLNRITADSITDGTIVAADVANGTITAAKMASGVLPTAHSNSAFSHANAAFNQANTDVTTITATAATYGNAIAIPSITLAANGRVSAISNTTIVIDPIPNILMLSGM